MGKTNARVALQDVIGPLNDLTSKLASENGPEWFLALKKFLRKEQAWSSVVSNLRFSTCHSISIPKRSVKEAIAAGKYDYVNDNINGKNFQAHESDFGDKYLVPVWFDVLATSGDVVREMEKSMNLRPATLMELLAFGEKYPDEQRKFPIIALGSSCVIDGRRSVPCLNGHDFNRELGLGYWDGGWHACYRFLAVRK